MVLVISGIQVPTTTATVQMKDGQLIPAGVFEGVVDPSRVGPNGAEFSGNKTLAACCDIVCMCLLCVYVFVIIVIYSCHCQHHEL